MVLVPLLQIRIMKIGIIVSQFNSEITDKLLAGAERGLKDLGKGGAYVTVEYEVFRVPGAFEIPLMAAHLAESKRFDGLIALGVVIKGETDHYDMICRGCTDGIMRVMLDYKIPIAFEVLMVEDEKLALARAGDDSTNKGYVAVGVIVEMLRNF